MNSIRNFKRECCRSFVVITQRNFSKKKMKNKERFGLKIDVGRANRVLSKYRKKTKNEWTNKNKQREHKWRNTHTRSHTVIIITTHLLKCRAITQWRKFYWIWWTHSYRTIIDIHIDTCGRDLFADLFIETLIIILKIHVVDGKNTDDNKNGVFEKKGKIERE